MKIKIINPNKHSQTKIQKSEPKSIHTNLNIKLVQAFN